MQKTVLTFGLIAGVMLSAMMLLTLPFLDAIGFDRGLVIGYTTMVLAFMMTYFGVRSYRDNVAGGSVSFGRAFKVGILITLIASVCYVATWEFVYYKLAPDFGEKMSAHEVAKVKASGASAAQVEAKQEEMQKFSEMYKNPLVNVAMTFIEPLPVGLLFTLVTAAVLSRKRRPEFATIGS